VECTAQENANIGIFCDFGCVVRDCNVTMNFLTGIHCVNQSEVVGNHCQSNAGGVQGAGTANIEVIGSANRISDNDCKDAPSNYLLTIGATGNTVFANSATLPGPGGNYALLGFPNDVAPIVTAATAGTAYDNIAY